jgi:hypothetical protein
MWETYLNFVEERHLVWVRRQAGEPGPWTDEPIVATRKFTNVFRVLDVGSQFLAKMLWDGDSTTTRDIIARCLLYRTTNRPEPWEWIHHRFGGYPTANDMTIDLAMEWLRFQEEGGQVFSGAYVIRPEPPTKGANKVLTMVKHARRVADALDEYAWDHADMATRFGMLKAFPGIGDFIAMQVLTDFGYSPLGEDTENEFVVAGPGAVKGAQALHPGHNPGETITVARSILLDDFPSVRLGGRPPSLMDVQNTLCEFSKYVRYLGRPLGEPYVPAHPGPQPEPFLPPHWSI